MEVHHHSHTSDTGLHRGKKWTHYFWEFLMLFLAVFCGFLAEYQLEHKIEKNRERQFMRSMVEDLKSDTSSIIMLNLQRQFRLEIADSLRSAIIDNSYSEKGSSFYYWGRIISRRAFFYSADGTIQQLKNSGGLRLISQPLIADKIIAYDVLYREILNHQDLEETHMNEYRSIAGKVFDAGVFNSMVNLKDTIAIQRPAGNPSLKDNSSYILNEMANKLHYWATGSTRLKDLLEQLKTRANELIHTIKKEYHLQ